MTKITIVYTDGHQEQYNVTQQNNMDQLNVQDYPGFLHAKIVD